MKHLATIALTAALASPAFAGLATTVTEGGGNYVTGGRGSMVSYGLSQYLAESNNHFVVRPSPASFPGGRGGLGAFRGDTDVNPLGVLLHGTDGTLFTYDQLAYQPVLQILGYDASGFGGGLSIPTNGAGYSSPNRFGPAGLWGEGSGRRAQGFEPFSFSSFEGFEGGGGGGSTVVVPEPASLTLMALAATWMLQRRRRRNAIAAAA